MSNYLSVLLITFDLEFLIILWDFFSGGKVGEREGVGIG